MPADPGAHRLELILQQLEQLPTLPSVAVRVLEISNKPSANLGELVKVLEADASLTARLIQLSHRADRGVSSQVKSVARAVSLLGMEAVRNTVLAISTFATFPAPQTTTPHTKTPGFDRHGFWQHSLAVACCAELLCECLPSGFDATNPRPANLTPSVAFTAGLLHDLGKIALDTVLPKSFARVVEGVDLLRGNIADLERSVIGLDHQLVGKRLAERWQLPTCFRDVIWLHGQAPATLAAGTPHAMLTAIVSMADLIVRENHIGYSGNYQMSPRRLWAEGLNLTPEQLQQVERKLVRAIEPRAELLGLNGTTTIELYQQALLEANRQLGQVVERLASRNQKLARRAKVFEILGHFHAELRTDTPLPDVLAAIAAGAAAVSAEEFPLPTCAFSGGPGAVAVLVGPQSSKTEWIDTAPTMEPELGGPILPVGPSLDWVTSLMSPALVGTARFWIPLVAEGELIGGVMWGAAAGEAARLGPMAPDLSVLSQAWALALRGAQRRDQSRHCAEQLAIAMSQLTAAQNELLQSRTMVAVGEMAAGAAHELNNPLTIIAGRSQLLASQLGDPKQQSAAALIAEQSHRASAIVTELMDFARPAAAQRGAVELADLVTRSLQAAQLADPVVDRTIEVTLTEVPTLWVDVTQVSAAITELIANALQATDAQQGHIAIHGSFEAATKQVALTIVDNGHGMDQATLQHAFDPFFSAKPAGRRRGMGLAKAQRWVQSSGGSIRLQSPEGKGTRSIVLLPVRQMNGIDPSSAADEMPAEILKLQGSTHRPAKIPA